MSTMFGVLFGYVLRGTTGSEGFNRVVDSARAVTGTREFDNLVRAAKSHVAYVIKDLSDSLAKGADHMAVTLTAGQPVTAEGESSEWERWPPAGRTQGRPFTDDVPWPDS